MSEVWTRISLYTREEADYKVAEALFRTQFDKAELWPVEAYDATNCCIESEAVLGTEDEVVELVKAMDLALRRLAGKETLERRQWLETMYFKIVGTTEFTNCGEQVDYVIERGGGDIMIRETEHYTCYSGFSFEDYEDFCTSLEAICPEVAEFVSEDDFDPDGEYALTYGHIFVDETPSFGKPYPLSQYRKAGEVVAGHGEAAGRLSVEDMDNLLAGAFNEDMPS